MEQNSNNLITVVLLYLFNRYVIKNSVTKKSFNQIEVRKYVQFEDSKFEIII